MSMLCNAKVLEPKFFIVFLSYRRTIVLLLVFQPILRPKIEKSCATVFFIVVKVGVLRRDNTNFYLKFELQSNAKKVEDGQHFLWTFRMF